MFDNFWKRFCRKTLFRECAKSKKTKYCWVLYLTTIKLEINRYFWNRPVFMNLWRWKTFAFWKISNSAWKLSRFDDFIEFPKAKNFRENDRKTRKLMLAKVSDLKVLFYGLWKKYSPVYISWIKSTPGSIFFLGNKNSFGKKVPPGVLFSREISSSFGKKRLFRYLISYYFCKICELLAVRKRIEEKFFLPNVFPKCLGSQKKNPWINECMKLFALMNKFLIIKKKSKSNDYQRL